MKKRMGMTRGISISGSRAREDFRRTSDGTRKCRKCQKGLYLRGAALYNHLR